MNILDKEVLGSVGAWVVDMVLLVAEDAAILGILAACVVVIWIVLGAK